MGAFVCVCVNVGGACGVSICGIWFWSGWFFILLIVVPSGMCYLLGARSWLGLQFSSKVLFCLSVRDVFEIFMMVPCF